MWWGPLAPYVGNGELRRFFLSWFRPSLLVLLADCGEAHVWHRGHFIHRFCFFSAWRLARAWYLASAISLVRSNWFQRLDRKYNFHFTNFQDRIMVPIAWGRWAEATVVAPFRMIRFKISRSTCQSDNQGPPRESLNGSQRRARLILPAAHHL